MSRASQQEVLVCLDKFRGSMTASQASSALAAGLAAAAPGQPIRVCPVADGGEGTVEVMIDAGYDRVEVVVSGPVGQAVTAVLAIKGDRSVIELAQASGLELSEGRALKASTFGVGQLILMALSRGCSEIVVALGGSGTTDGGAGMLQALGARLSDGSGRELGRGGANLSRLATIDLSRLDPRLHDATLIAACDVWNPLLGVEGAARVFGPQKGADSVAIEQLECGLTKFAQVMEATTGLDVAGAAGAGAAGGTGYAILALRGRACSGVEFVLDQVGVAAVLPTAALIVVGEGSIDAQSLRGKAPIGIAALAARYGVPVIAVAGEVLLDAALLASLGIRSSYSLIELTGDRAKAMEDAPRLLYSIGASIVSSHLSAAHLPGLTP